jgi:hypothetical protein
MLLPVLAVVWLLTAVFWILARQPLYILLLEIIGSVFLALAGHRIRLLFVKRCPLNKTIRTYLEQVSGCNQRCSPGPNRAVTIGSLSHMFNTFHSYLLRRNMYFLEPYLIRPLTRGMKLSFAELVGPQLLDFFVSHFWGLAFHETLEALKKHAAEASSSIKKPRSAIAYWICTFSNNQWKLWEEIPPGAGPESSSFFKALTSGFCNATCMVVNEEVEPLKRSWCLFELFLTFVLKQRTEWSPDEIKFQGLQLITASGVLNSGKSSMDIALAITSTVATIKLEDAKASRTEDEEMIKAKVLEEYGSFEKPNNLLKNEIRKILEKTRSRAQKDIDELLQKLQTKDAIVIDTSSEWILL